MNIPYRGETKDLNDKARENAPGKFIQLSRGSTHFILWESNDGKTIVFVHGIAGPLGI